MAPLSRKFMIGGTIALALGCACWFAWRMLTGSMYVPGEVRRKTELLFPGRLTTAGFEGAPAGAKFIDVGDGILLHYFTEGHGPKHVVVLHGGPGAPTKIAWPALKDLEPSKYTFHFFDQRGSGLSTKPIKQLNASLGSMDNAKTLYDTLGVAQHLRDIEKIRRMVAASSGGEDGGYSDGQIAIVGHSFGAFLATLYAAEFPEHVARLILLCPADLLVLPPENDGLMGYIGDLLSSSEKAEYAEWMKKEYFASFAFDKTEEELTKTNAKFGVWFMLAMTRHHPSGAAKIAEFSAKYAHPFPGWGCQGLFFSMGMHHDYRSAVRSATKNSTFKTYLIHGEKDLQPLKVTTERYVPLFRQGQVEVQTIPESGHFPMVEWPEATKALVASCLNA